MKNYNDDPRTANDVIKDYAADFRRSRVLSRDFVNDLVRDMNEVAKLATRDVKNRINSPMPDPWETVRPFIASVKEDLKASAVLSPDFVSTFTSGVLQEICFAVQTDLSRSAKV